MALPVYPPELPRLVLPQPFQENYGDGRRFSRRDGGPDVPRPGWSAAPNTVALTTLLTRVERARFDRFWIEEIQRGLKPFLMRDPGMDGFPAFCADGSPMLMANGKPALMACTWLCIIAQNSLSAKPNGVDWDIAFQVAVMP